MVPTKEGRERKTVQPEIYLQPFLKQVEASDKKVQWISADMPERAKLTGQVGHAGARSCTMCYGAALTRPIRWCAPGSFGQPDRTLDRMKGHYQRHFANPPQEDMTKVGYAKKSVIVESLPNFDLPGRLVIDSMHHLYAGMAKSLFQLTFKFCGMVQKDSPVRMSDPKQMAPLLNQTRRPSDFSRSPRPMDHPHYKVNYLT